MNCGEVAKDWIAFAKQWAKSNGCELGPGSNLFIERFKACPDFPKEKNKIEVWQWRLQDPLDRNGWKISNYLLTDEEAKNAWPVEQFEKHAGPFLVDAK